MTDKEQKIRDTDLDKADAALERAAIRRRIVEANSEWVQPATRTIEDYDRARLVEAMRSVMRAGKEYPRDRSGSFHR